MSDWRAVRLTVGEYLPMRHAEHERRCLCLRWTGSNECCDPTCRCHEIIQDRAPVVVADGYRDALVR